MNENTQFLKDVLEANEEAKQALNDLGAILVPKDYELVPVEALNRDVSQYSPSFNTESFDSFIEYVTWEIEDEAVETVRPICWVNSAGADSLEVTAMLNRGSSKYPVMRARNNSFTSNINYARYNAEPSAQWNRVMRLVGDCNMNQKEVITNLLTIGIKNVTGETSMEPNSETLSGSQVIAAIQSLTADIAQQTTVRASHSSIEMSAMDKVAAKSEATLPMVLNFSVPFSSDYENSNIRCLVEYPVKEVGERKVVTITLVPLNLPEVYEGISEQLMSKVRDAFDDLPISVVTGTLKF